MDKWLLPSVSTYGPEIDDLFRLIYYITGIVFILVAATMVWFLIKYRDRGDGRRAIYSHGNDRLEIIWTVIPTLIFLALALKGASSWARIKMGNPEPDLLVRVEGKQFNWVFTYAGPDGVLGTKDDKTMENLFRVPVDKNVVLRLEAKDVIHSFFVPQLRTKQDAMPGRTITAWFQATQAGDYEIPCAELCGFGHTTMIGKLRVLSAADWDKWVAEKWPAPAPLATPAAVLPTLLEPTPAPAADPSGSPAAAVPAASPTK